MNLNKYYKIQNSIFGTLANLLYVLLRTLSSDFVKIKTKMDINSGEGLLKFQLPKIVVSSTTTAILRKWLPLFVTKATQFCVTADSSLI